MANECIPLFDAGAKPTCHVQADVVGKRLVEISGPPVNGLLRVSPATAAATAFGVSFKDAAAGTTVGVYTDGVLPVTAGGSFSAGALLQVATGGKVVAATTGVPVAKALSDGSNNNDAFVQLLRTALAPAA